MLATMQPAHGAIALPPPVAKAVKAIGHVPLPVLAPSVFDGVDFASKSLVVAGTKTAHSYTLEFDLAPDCNGANVCSAGSFTGSDKTAMAKSKAEALSGKHPDELAVGPRKPDADDRKMIAAGTEVLDRPVALAHGLKGYYTEYVSGASDGGNSELRWMQNGCMYSIATRISNQKNLVAIANSAIANGPR